MKNSIRKYIPRIAGVIGALIVVGFLIFMGNLTQRAYERRISAGFIKVPTSTSAQQTIDTNLSLTPSSSTIATTPKPTSTRPPTSGSPSNNPAYAGCKLALSFAITGGNLQSQGNMNYSLAAKNIGRTSCQSASISVYYADNESYVSASPRASADGYYWTLGTLAPGKTSNITLTTNRIAPISTGAVTNEACLSADNGSDACSNSSANTGLAISQSQASPQNVPQQQQITTLANSLSVASGEEIGAWIWTPISEMSSADMQSIVNAASLNHFNSLYVTTDESLNLSDPQQLAAYESKVDTFIGFAMQKNIAVDAEAGWRDWGAPENRAKAYDIISFVVNYNSSHTNKFRGVQYDIEPYLLPEYASNQAGVLTDYVGLVDALVTKAKIDALPLTMVLPHFYDSAQKWTPQITEDGITAYPYDHIVRLLNELPNGRVIIMAYRNFASDSDGSIALSKQEVDYADNSNVKVIVAQETGPVDPSYVTFNALTRSDLFTQAQLITQAFASDRSFDGIAIDYLDTFLNLP